MIELYSTRKSDNIRIKGYENVTNDDCPSFSGIVAGECKGDVWVDNTDNPHIAIAYSYAVGSYAFLGSISNETESSKLKDFIYNSLFSYLKEKGFNCFEYSIENDDLKPYIQKMFEEKFIQSEKEYSFRYRENYNSSEYPSPDNKNFGYSILGVNNIQNLLTDKYIIHNSLPDNYIIHNSLPDNYIIQNSLPENYIMQRIDNDFWSKVLNGDYTNESFLTERLLESWGNIENFCEKSVGFCITYLDRIAAVILGTARFKNIVPIDIETKDEFKKMGLGYSLTIEFVKECLKKGLIAQWDCVESNPVSYKLAEKAGFQLFKENVVYWFEI